MSARWLVMQMVSLPAIVHYSRCTSTAGWNTEIRKATKLPDMKERLVSEGFDIDDSPPEVFQAVLKRDVEKWAIVVGEK